MNNAGFNRDGSSPQSITNVITAEIEAARSLALGCQIISSLDRKAYERWAWEAWSKVGASFITSPPDRLGFIRDDEFMVIPPHILGNLIPSYLLWQADTLGRRDDDWIDMALTLQLIRYPVVDSGQSTTVFSLLCSQ